MSKHRWVGTVMAACGCVAVVATMAEAKMDSRDAGWALIKQRSELLKKNISSFSLRLQPNLATDKPYYGVQLSCLPMYSARSDPFVQRVHISTNAACLIVDHLAGSGFLARAQEGNWRDKDKMQLKEGYCLTVEGWGAQDQVYYDDLGWNLNAIASIEAIRAVVADQDQASQALGLLLGRLSGWKKMWEQEAKPGEDASATKAKAERPKLPENSPSVSLEQDGMRLTATRDGKTLWIVQLREAGQSVEVLEGDQVRVNPGKQIFDLRTGKSLGTLP